MMAFFLTMPISRMMPMTAMMSSVVPAPEQRQQRADGGRRQRGQDGDRVDVALVQHAQHDVHGDHRRQDEQQRVGQRRLEGQRRALEAGLHRPACRAPAACGVDGLHRLAQRHAGARLNDTVAAGNWPTWLTASGRPLFDARHRRQRHLPPPVPTARRAAKSPPGPCWNCGCTSSTTRYWLDWVKMVEMRRWPKALYSAVSMAATVTPRRLAAGAVDLDIGLQALVLQVAGHVGQLGQRAQRAHQRGTHSAARAIGRLQQNWYCVRLTRSSMVRSCTGCMYSVMPGTLAAAAAGGA
jgi:hypothetical protein